MIPRSLKFRTRNPLVAFILLRIISLSISKVEMGDLKPNIDKSEGYELISGDFAQQEIIYAVSLTSN